MFNESKKSPLVITNYDSLMLVVKRFSYRRNGVDYIYEGGVISLENNKLNHIYIETPFNTLKKSTQQTGTMPKVCACYYFYEY